MTLDLQRMRYLIAKIPDALMVIQRAESRAEKVTSTISDMPHGSMKGSALEESVIRIDELKSAYQEVIDELNQRREDLKPIIAKLDDGDQRAVMRLRYIYGYSVRQICRGLYRSDKQVRRYLESAESAVYEIAEKMN